MVNFAPKKGIILMDQEILAELIRTSGYELRLSDLLTVLLVMTEVTAGTRLSKSHQMFQLHIMIQFRLFI